MVKTNVNKDPADSKVNIFRRFISFEDFTASREAAIHITIEAMYTMTITPSDIFNTPLIRIIPLNALSIVCLTK